MYVCVHISLHVGVYVCVCVCVPTVHGQIELHSLICDCLVQKRELLLIGRGIPPSALIGCLSGSSGLPVAQEAVRRCQVRACLLKPVLLRLPHPTTTAER